MNTVPPVLPGSFKDRSIGLLIFGILTVLGGVLCGLMVLFLGFSLSLPSRPGVPAQSLQMLLPAMAIYSLAAVGCIWLGVGSIMKRRWARALLLIGSWSGLIVGVISFIFIGISLPEIQKTMRASMPEASPALQMVPLIIMGVTMLIFYVLLPGSWLLFYRGRNVKATCEHYDSVIRWTDHCPLPVLGLAVWLGISVVSCFVMVFGNVAVLPFFGMFIYGTPAIAATAVLTLVFAYAMWRVYLLDVRGWWIVVIGVVLFAISALITYSRHDLMEVYRLLNFPPEQLAQIEKYNFFTGNMLYLSVILWVVPALAYLFYIKRFFKGPSTASIANN